jgi:serine/threonine protein kinase
MSDWVGQTLGKVHIDLLLARGGMAEVYLGTHTTLQRPVAVKVLRNQYQDDPDLLDRFQREARVVAMLRHPNIVQVFDFDTVDGHPYLVMEYVPGVSLSAYLRALHARTQRLELPLAAHLLDALAGALHYAHESGIIHRDVKPGNILLTSRTTPVETEKALPADVQPVLTDFGLVRFLNSSRQTSTGVIAGTPTYMSPEQARGETTDARTDIYSLGIVLYEMLAGRVPFEAESTLGVLNKIINDPTPPIAGLSPALQAVVNRALAKNKQERYQTPLELSKAFNEALHERAEALTIVPGEIAQLSTPAMKNIPPKSKRRVWPLVAGAIVLAAISILIFLNRPVQTDLPPATYASTAESPTQLSMTEPAANQDLQQVGILRFQDGAALLDQVTMRGLNMPPPPEGSQYEVWLIEESGEQRRSIGVLNLDAEGKGTVAYVDSQGRNLLAIYNKMEITIEPKPDNNPNPSKEIAFSASLPPGGLTHVRHLLVSFSGAPNGIALADGLVNNAKLVDDLALAMLDAYGAGDETTVRKNAEAILNLLVGNQSEDHRDWNGDGEVADPGDGYGLLLNGDNTGYIQAVYSHADYSANAPDATQSMIVHGGHVKIAAQNLEQWAPVLRDHMKTILQAPFGPGLEQTIRESAALADEMLKGTDLNGNEQIEPIPGEGGAMTAYEHAYYMADMPIFSNKRP